MTSKTTRRRLLQAAGLGAAALAAPKWLRAAGSATPEKPNIVFIMADDMGYADLGCYGSKTIRTPRLDRMAAEGMRFTDAYSGATVCAPARCCLMTGYHVGRAAVRANGGFPILDSDVTVAEVLNKAGYATGGFGKWGLGDVGSTGAPEKQGFDVFFGYYHQVHAHDYYTDHLFRNGQSVPLDKQYSHHVIFRENLKFIRENKDRPFFCYCPWTPPHGKYQIPDDEPALAAYKDKPWQHDEKVAAAMDTMIDRNVGEILDLLKELKLDEKTIVFFCSDNGAAKRFDGVHDSSGPLKGAKRSMYEGGIRVPLIVRWPGRIAAGAASDLPWCFPDVMPTLAELAGATDTAPRDIDGISVVPTLLGEAAAGRAQKLHKYLFWAAGPGWRAARMGNWKAVARGADEPQLDKLELYDLSKDIGEANNVAADNPEIARQMLGFLSEAWTQPRRQKGSRIPFNPAGTKKKRVRKQTTRPR